MAIKALFFCTLAVAFFYTLYFAYESSSKVSVAQERVEYIENECEAQMLQMKRELTQQLEQERIKLSKANEEKESIEQHLQEQINELHLVMGEKDTIEKQKQELMTQLQQAQTSKLANEDLRKQLLEMQQAAEASNLQVKDLRATIENTMKKHQEELGLLEARNVKETANMNEQLGDMKRRYEDAVSKLAKVQSLTAAPAAKHQISNLSESQNNEVLTPLLTNVQTRSTEATSTSVTKASLKVLEVNLIGHSTSNLVTPAAKRSKQSNTNTTAQIVEPIAANTSVGVTPAVKQRSKKSKVRKAMRETTIKKQSNVSHEATPNTIHDKSSDSAKIQSESTTKTETKVAVTQTSTASAEKIGLTLSISTSEPFVEEQAMELQQPAPPIGSYIKDNLNLEVDQNGNSNVVQFVNTESLHAQRPKPTNGKLPDDANSDKRDNRAKRRRLQATKTSKDMS